MLGCMLRVAGRDFDVDEFLATSLLHPCSVWRRGERPSVSPSLPSKDAGFNLVVSDAPGHDLPLQVRDAIRFLTEYHQELARLLTRTGVEGAVLDFGIWCRDVAVQCNSLPAPLIGLAGGLGLAIEMSIYPEAGGTGGL